MNLQPPSPKNNSAAGPVIVASWESAYAADAGAGNTPGMNDKRGAGPAASLQPNPSAPAPDTLAAELAELKSILLAVIDRLPGPLAPVPASRMLNTRAAATLMGFKDCNSFISAARSARVSPTGNRRAFLWNPADLARWQAAPKTPSRRRSLPVMDARATRRRHRDDDT